jgi:hypothetical protein
MADLRLSSAELGELITAFNGFGDLLNQACLDIRNGDAAVTGNDPLAGDVHAFTSSWDYGLGKLGQHGRDCSAQLTKINNAFDQLEKQLTDGLKGAKGGSKA